MNALVDTHVLLWAIQNHLQLSQTARSFLTNPANGLYLSIVSFWELAIKISIGKLTLTTPLTNLFNLAMHHYQMALLPVSFSHVEKVATLPMHHRDSFDRMLISQAIVENIVIVSGDPTFDQYPPQRIW